MGTISSKESRRISFNNTFAVSPALVVHKSIGDDNVLDFDAITAVTEKNDDFLFPESIKPPEITKEDRRKEELEVDYWANRIESLKQEHRLINRIIETEYEKTLEKTSTLLKKPYSGTDSYNKIKPCFEWRAKIMQCYEDNPHQPLACSPIVQAFNNCVTSCSIED